MITDLIRSPLKLLVHKKSIPVLCLSLALLAGCERPMPRVYNGLPLPVQTFAHVQKLPVHVSSVLIERGDGDQSVRSGDFVIPLHDRAIQYLSQKFEARDDWKQGDRLVAYVENSSVYQDEQPSKSEVLNKIGVGQFHHYVLTLSLRFEHVGEQGNVIYGKVLNAEKSFSVTEHSSMADREQAQFDAVEEIFKMIDPQVNQIIRNEMNLVY